MAYIPCDTCKYRTEETVGHRIFVGCNDSEKQKSFHEDDFTYRHSCDNYEKDSNKENK